MFACKPAAAAGTRRRQSFASEDAACVASVSLSQAAAETYSADAREH